MASFQPHPAPVPSSILAHLKGVLLGLRPAERRVAEYLLAHPEEGYLLSITELAMGSGVSEATVVRLAKTLGYRGYQELRIALARDVMPPLAAIQEEITAEDSLDTALKKICEANSRTMERTFAQTDLQVLAEVAGRLLQARRIEIFGVGTSAVAAQDAHYKFLRLGLASHFQGDPHLQAMATAALGPGDVALAISQSGATRDTLECAEGAKESGAFLVALTSAGRSPLARLADRVLLTATTETPFTSGALTSIVSQMLVVDFLFVAVALSRPEETVRQVQRTAERVARKKV